MALIRQKDVLESLRPVWVDSLGIDEEEVSVCPEENLIDWLKSLGNGIFEELDFADILFRLEREFGLKASSDEIGQFLYGNATNQEEWERAVKPTLTLDRFADWVLDHTPMPSYSPVKLLGTPCREAGIFLAIQDVVRDVCPDVPPFGPGNEVLRSLRGRKLVCLWNRLRFHSAGSLRQLRWPFDHRGSLMALVGCVGAVISLFLIGYEPALSGLTFVSSAAFFVLGCKLRWTGNPLPSGISTFKDLSTEMARALDA